MRPESWAWSPIEPWLRWLYRLLAVVGAGLLVKLGILLLIPMPGEGPVPARFDRAGRCVEAPLPAEHRHRGLSEVFARPAAMPAECWSEIRLPLYGAVEDQPFPSPESPVGRVWMRLRYDVPVDWPEGEPLLIFVPRAMGLAWQIRVNGSPVADDLNDWRMTWNRPLTGVLPASQLSPGQALEIDVVLAYLAEIGHSLAQPVVGPASRVGPLAARWELLQSTLPQACSLVLAIMGTFFLAFWLARPGETSHLLLALASLAWCVCNLQYVLPRQDDPALERWYNGIALVSVVWFAWLVYLFALCFDTRRMRWIERSFPVYVLVMTALATPLWGMLDDEGTVFLMINDGFAALVTGVISLLALRGGSMELKVIALTLLIGLGAGLHDTALFMQLIQPESSYLLPYAGLLVFGSFLFAVQRRYVYAINAHEALSASLAERLAQREAELTENHRRLRELERVEALETERRRLMRDMHDGLGSALISSLVAIERGQPAPGETAAMLRECVDELRLVIDSLDPGERDVVALLAALRFRMERRLASAGIRLEWHMPDLPALPWLGPPEALHLLRIFQEVLVNVIKHAGASRIVLSASLDGGEVEIRCVDDGSGFDISVPSVGRGLRSMVERCDQLGGRVLIASNLSGGTDIRVRLPIVPADGRESARERAHGAGPGSG
ncbi:MAG: sensor histidine kinase [Methylococcaceae bacterium]|nr:sensor histidine kinase [Methylococcaceae bacterium]